MSTMHTRCSACRERVTLEPARLVVVTPPRDEADRQGELLFACPACPRTDVQAIPRPLALVLVHQGATELASPGTDVGPGPHPEDPPAGPRLGPDDVLALHQALLEPDWFDRLRVDGSGVPGEEPA